jgi:hypothetical protein
MPTSMPKALSKENSDSSSSGTKINFKFPFGKTLRLGSKFSSKNFSGLGLGNPRSLLCGRVAADQLCNNVYSRVTTNFKLQVSAPLPMQIFAHFADVLGISE